MVSISNVVKIEKDVASNILQAFNVHFESEAVIDAWVKVNGGRLQPNVFTYDYDSDLQSGISSIISIKELPQIVSRVLDMPNGTLPFAYAEGGNYVLIDQSGVISFWDHEFPSKRYVVASSIDQFLSCLQKFDPQSVVLKPGQVTDVWIHPDFQKIINNNNRNNT